MNIHAPSPSLLEHVCVCGAKDSDPTWHRQPVATVSPKREPAAVARRTDPETSWEAARSVLVITAKQRAVLDLLRDDGAMTDEDIARRYPRISGYPKQSPSGLRTRRSELVKAGLLHWTGETRIGSTGRKMRIWAAVAG